MKRLFDIIVSTIGIVICFPILLIFTLLIWFYDFHNPFYVANRVGKGHVTFKMIKFRSMNINADKSGVVSTSSNDSRLTPIGKFIRKHKIDEIIQLLNVLKGDMSLIGPRPNVWDEVHLYTNEEKMILTIKPGITDMSSIVFSDLNDILQEYEDLNLAYNQLVRPWKSRLGILYIENQSFLLDIKILLLTVLSLFSKKQSLKYLQVILHKMNVNSILIEVCKRTNKLFPYPPPGQTEIILDR